MKRSLGLLLALCPLGASAFFDDFLGTSLASYWGFHGGEFNTTASYNVANSRLSVTGVYGVEQNNTFRIYGPTGGGTGPFTDFDFSAHVAWDPGEYQTLRLGVSYAGFSSYLPAYSIAYNKRPGQAPTIDANLGHYTGSPRGSLPAPPSGDHIFNITRRGSLISAYFNGSLIVEGVPQFQDPMTSISMAFTSGPGAFAPLHVDSVSLVPEPASLLMLGAGLFVSLAVRRRNHGR